MTDTTTLTTEPQSWDPRNRLWAHTQMDVSASDFLQTWLWRVAPTPNGKRERGSDISEEWTQFIEERGEKLGLRDATNRLWTALQEWDLVHPTRSQAIETADVGYSGGDYAIITLDWQTLYYEVRELYEIELHNRQ